MKKSFMTRVLATGLSLAMAFSLTAATNVSVASAASTPAMASKQFAVRVGGAAKSYKASAATRKSYKISKATVGNTDKATVKVNSSKKSIKVTPGTVAGSTVVKISFKNIKTKKTTSKKYRCVVKAAVVEKQAIVKAEATGVKTITLTMAKEVASVASPVAITVKKGSSNRTIKTSVADGKTITLTMDAKLIAGDYAVTIKGLETEDLTATVSVAKDETLTSYYISDEIIQVSINDTTRGYIYYAALNQYGEKMNANLPTVSCTFGKQSTASPYTAKTATATANGMIWFEDIPAILSIVGTTGQVVLVDGTVGVSTTKTVTFSSPATTSEIKLAGLYNMSKAIMKDITEKDTISNYRILFTAKDQYGNEMDAAHMVGVSATVAGGITKVEVMPNNASTDLNTTKPDYLNDIVVDGKEYIAISLQGNSGDPALAGSYTLTIVNRYKGLLATETYNVVDYTVIKSVNITADGVLYNNEDNTLTYEVTDSEGNSITSYPVLFSTVDFDNYSSQFKYIKWVKQADGTAKLVAKPAISGTFNDANNKKETTLGTFVVKANEAVSTNYLISTKTLTIGEDREVTGLTGLKSTVATAYPTAVTGQTIGLGDILAADQYGNPVAKDDKVNKFPAYIMNRDDITTVKGALSFGNAVTGVSIYCPNTDVMVVTVTGSKVSDGTAEKSGSALWLDPKNTGTAVLYMKYFNAEILAKANNTEKASETNYDAKVYFTVTNTDKNVSNDNLKIKEVNSGYSKQATVDKSVTLAPKDIKVVSTIAGQEIQIPASQYVITGYENNKITDMEAKTGTNTKTAKVKIRVTTHDANTNINYEKDLEAEFTISTLNAKVAAIKGTNDSIITTTGGYVAAGTAMNKNNFVDMFKYNTQYNDFSDGATSGSALMTVSGGATTIADAAKAYDCVKYSINVENVDTKAYQIKNDGTNDALVTALPAGAVVKVTATVGDTSKTVTFTVM